MKSKRFVVFWVCLLITDLLHAQSNTLDDVHLFQIFHRDASFTVGPYFEIGFNYDNFTRYFRMANFAVQAGYGLTPKFEVGGTVSFLDLDPKLGDRHSGVSDLMLTVKHRIFSGATKFALGALVILPTGTDKVRQGRTNLGAYFALRHPFPSGIVTTANIGAISGRDMILDHVEVRLALSGAVIVPASRKLALVGEFDYQNEIDYQIFTAGLDYRLAPGSRLRAGVGSNFGIGNGAPEISFGLRLLQVFAHP